jgi:phosphoglucosamine mutase
MGAHVFLVGPMPTPAVAHLTRSLGAAAGIMLTASHNPYDDNGIKVFDCNGYKLSDQLEEQIEGLVLGGDLSSDHIRSDSVGKAQRIDDAVGRYIEFSKSTVDNQNLEGLRIVLDCANGAAYQIGPWIFRELGAEVIKVGVEPDGYNINNQCGALYPENAGDLVRRYRADLGIALDGDADRVIFCDSAGNVIDGDRILAMCALDMKQRGTLAKDTLVVTTMSNLGLHEAMRAAGIRVVTTPVGDRNVIDCMRHEGYNLGGEKSGHLIFLDHATTGDGIISALRVLRLMSTTGRTIGDLAGCMTEYPQRLESVRVKRKPPLESCPAIVGAIEACEGDLGEEGRVVVRYSGTEAKLRVLVESRSAAKVDLWTERLVATVMEEIGA